MKSNYRIEVPGIAGAAWDINETVFRKINRMTGKLPDTFEGITEDELRRHALFKLMSADELIGTYGRIIILKKENVIHVKEDSLGSVESELLLSVPKDVYLLVVELIKNRKGNNKKPKKRNQQRHQ